MWAGARSNSKDKLQGHCQQVKSIDGRQAALHASHRQNKLLIGLLALFVVRADPVLRVPMAGPADRADGGRAADRRRILARACRLRAAPRRDRRLRAGADAAFPSGPAPAGDGAASNRPRWKTGCRGRMASASESLSFQARIAEIVQRLEDHAGRMSTASENLVSISSEADARAAASAQSTQRVSGHVDVVASSIRDIAATLADVVGDAERTSAVAAAARSLVAAARDDVNALTEAARTIEPVIGLIEDVANQTNLLALNATIEAARAGEMGRGFGVVAHEVKQLATRTARATEEVRSGLHGIAAASSRIVGARRQARGIRSSRSMRSRPPSPVRCDGRIRIRRRSRRTPVKAAADVREVAATVKDVAAMIADAKQAADLVTSASTDLGQQAADLKAAVVRFIDDDRKDRRMTIAPACTICSAQVDVAPLTPCVHYTHDGQGAALAHRRAGGVHGLVGRDREAAQRRPLVRHAVHAAQDHRDLTLAVVLLRLCYRDPAVVAAEPQPSATAVAAALAPLRSGHPGSAAGMGRHFRFRCARNSSRASRCPRSGRNTPAMPIFSVHIHAYLAFGLLALVALHIGIAMQDYMMRADDPDAAQLSVRTSGARPSARSCLRCRRAAARCCRDA